MQTRLLKDEGRAEVGRWVVAAPTVEVTVAVLVAVAALGCHGPSTAPRPESDSTMPTQSPSGSRPPTVAETPSRARAVDGRYISWREHLVDDEQLGGLAIRGADGLELADLDGDGFEDIVSVHEDSSHIRIAFGSADPDRWQLVTLAAGEEAGAAEDIAIDDLDGDGCADVLVACELAHLILFRNPCGEEARRGQWPRLMPQISRERGSWIRVYLADLNQDGRLEAVAPNKADQNPQPLNGVVPDRFPTDWPLTAISIFQIAGDSLDDESWSEHVLARVQMPVNSQPVDLDGDGDLDIVGGSRPEARIFWFENLLENPGGELRFHEHPITVTNRSAPQQGGARRLTGMSMDFADLDGDARLDIVLQETPELNVWLKQPAVSDQPWVIHPIGSLAPDHPTGVLLVDVDDDGDLDLFTGGYSDPPREHDGASADATSIAGRLNWFENKGSEGQSASPSWRRHDVSRRVRGMYDGFVPRDVDGDGDVDIFATRGNGGTYDGVFWLEQIRSEEPLSAFFPARAVESCHLTLPPEGSADD